MSELQGFPIDEQFSAVLAASLLDSPSPEPLRIQNPVKHDDHAKRELVAARYYGIPAEGVEQAAKTEER